MTKARKNAIVFSVQFLCIGRRMALEEPELSAFPFLASPVGCLAFGFEPCFDEGDGAAVGGNGVRRREVRTVSGFGDRKVRAFGSDALDFEVRGVVTDVHAE